MAYYDVFGDGTDIRPLLQPGVCAICEASPDQTSTRVLDTMRWFRPSQFTDIKGRKYVCEPCAIDLGTAFGMVHGEQEAAALAQVTDLQKQLDDAHTQVASFTALQDAIAAVGVQLHSVPDPADETPAEVAPAADPAPAKATKENANGAAS